jgi:hypothetical protein
MGLNDMRVDFCPPTVQAQLAQEVEEEEEEEVSFIIDTQGDSSLVPAFNPLQQDFLAFPSSPPEGSQWRKEASIESVNEEDKVDSDLEVWNEEMDYSWHNRKVGNAIV